VPPAGGQVRFLNGSALRDFVRAVRAGRLATGSAEDGGDRSPITKALTGYRTPKKRALFSLEVKAPRLWLAEARTILR
jgi:hypothetical protein